MLCMVMMGWVRQEWAMNDTLLLAVIDLIIQPVVAVLMCDNKVFRLNFSCIGLTY